MAGQRSDVPGDDPGDGHDGRGIDEEHGHELGSPETSGPAGHRHQCDGEEVDADPHPSVADDRNEGDSDQNRRCVGPELVVRAQFDESQGGEGQADDHEPRRGLSGQIGFSLGDDDEERDVDDRCQDAADGTEDVPPLDRVPIDEDHGEEDGDGDGLGDDPGDETVADLTLGGMGEVELHRRVIGPGRVVLYPACRQPARIGGKEQIRVGVSVERTQGPAVPARHLDQALNDLELGWRLRKRRALYPVSCTSVRARAEAARGRLNRGPSSPK